MNAKELKRLQETVETLAERIQGKAAQRLQPDVVGRVLGRLHGFALECHTCQQRLTELAEHISDLRETTGELSPGELRPLQKSMDRAVSHLQNRHKLYVAGQAVSISLSMGLSLGVVFGLTVFDNIGVGLALGVAVGAGLGSWQDAKAKKDNRLI